MKKLLIIFLVMALTLGVMGFAFASAADLTVRGGTIQAGEDLDVKLYDLAVVNGWGLETDNGLVSFVRLGLFGLPDPGSGNEMTVFVVITGDVGQKLTGGRYDHDWGTSPITELPDIKIYFDSPVLAADIYDIHVYIEGSANSGN